MLGTTVGCGARVVVVVGAPPVDGSYVDEGGVLGGGRGRGILSGSIYLFLQISVSEVLVSEPNSRTKS